VIRTWSVLSAGALLALTASSARADDTKKVCTEAYDEAQSLRDAHKLRQAREQLRVCSQPACTAFIVKDCTAWLEAVERSLPTLVFSAKDRAGRDLLDVRVTVDGQLLVSTLDGEAVPVDPGPHTFRFERADGTSATQQVLVKEGDKNVGVTALLSRADAPAPDDAARTSPGQLPPPASSDEAAAPRPQESHTRRTIGLLVGGVGLAGLATGTVTGLLAMSSWSTAQGECPHYTGCSQQAMHDQTQASGLAKVSTVAFIAGGALTAVGAVVVLTAPAGDTGRVGFSLSPAALVATGVF
jgi:hypothetical protein